MKRIRWRIPLAAVCLTLMMLNALAGPLAAQEEPEPPPLAEYGPYGVGVTTMIFVDESREDREVGTEIWYPAIMPEGEEAPEDGLRDAQPDDSDAPYPLILFVHSTFGSRTELAELMAHLASHGFVVAGADHPSWRLLVVDWPLDILFVLDQLAALPESELATLINADHVGVFGYSSGGGGVALCMTGGRFDPEYFLDACTEPPTSQSHVCHFHATWESIVSRRASLDPPLEEGQLWPATTDERIHAVLAIGPCIWALLGERGFATADVPTFIIGATLDDNYQVDTVLAFTHLGAEERYLLSVIDANHQMLPIRLQYRGLLNHFTTAFLGYYLQGQEDYAEYLTEEYVEGFEDLAWGVYEEE